MGARTNRAHDRQSVEERAPPRDARPGGAVPERSGARSVIVTIEAWAVAVIALKAALIPIVIDTLAADPFVVPKVAVSRLTTSVLVALLFTRALHGRGRPIWSPVWPPLVAYVLISGASSAVAVHPYTALFGALRRQLGLLTLIDGAIVALAVATCVTTYRHVRWIGAGAFGGSAAVLGYGLVQLFGIDPVSWVDPTLSSTVGNRGVLAGYLVIVAAVAICAGLVFWQRLHRLERAALAAIAGVSILEVLASGARGPALAMGIAVVAAIVVARRSPAVPIAWKPWLVRGAVALILGLVAIVPFTPAGGRLASLVTIDQSTTERSLAYRTSFAAIRERPLLGVGPDGLTTVYLSLRPIEAARLATATAQTQSSTHSWVLHHAVGTGMLGLAAMLALVAAATLPAWRESVRPGGEAAALGLAAIVAYLGQGLFNVTDIVTELPFWLAVGLVALPLLRDDAPLVASRRPYLRRSRSGAPGGSVLPWVAGAILVGLVAAWAVQPTIGASRAIAVSNAARVRGNTQLAERASQEAVRLDPGRADHWNVVGLAYTRREPEKARAAFSKAVAAAPYDPIYLLNLGAEEAFLASTTPTLRAGALQHADEAARRDPFGPTTLFRAAEIHVFLEDQAGAVPIIERVMSIAPRDPRPFALLSELYSGLGDYRSAAAAYEKAASNRAGGGPLPPEERLALAHLYAKAGEPQRSRELTGAPSVATLTNCHHPCYFLVFASVAELRTDDAPDSVLRLENYRLDGRPLPDGTTVALASPRTVQITLPVRSLHLTPRDVIEVRNVANVFGEKITPDPTLISVP